MNIKLKVLPINEAPIDEIRLLPVSYVGAIDTDNEVGRLLEKIQPLYNCYANLFLARSFDVSLTRGKTLFKEHRDKLYALMLIENVEEVEECKYRMIFDRDAFLTSLTDFTRYVKHVGNTCNLAVPWMFGCRETDEDFVFVYDTFTTYFNDRDITFYASEYSELPLDIAKYKNLKLEY